MHECSRCRGPGGYAQPRVENTTDSEARAVEEGRRLVKECEEKGGKDDCGGEPGRSCDEWKKAQKYDCLEQRGGLLEGDCGKQMKGGGEPNQGPEHHNANQKRADVDVVPAAGSVTRCDLWLREGLGLA